ncbi:MAG: alpha/beta fold hydrolase [Anaerolineae bacterium]|nr:alpha/beta fold hydrolase [Anaerolineae bacterium]
MTHSGQLDVPNGNLFYTVEGEGMAIVCIHAGIADHHMWDAQVAAFAQKYQIIRYDLRGYGKSITEADTPYDALHDVRALLDHLEVQRAAIMGCSMGGAIAIDFALQFPDRVSALIPVAAAMSGYPGDDNADEQPIFQQMETLYHAHDYAQLADLEASVWAVGLGHSPEEGNRAVYDYVRGMVYERLVSGPAEGKTMAPEFPAYGNLDKINAPTLVIYGDRDTSVIQAIGKTLAEGIPGARLHVMSNAAHLPNMEYPDAFNRLVLDFLAGSPAD